MDGSRDGLDRQRLRGSLERSHIECRARIVRIVDGGDPRSNIAIDSQGNIYTTETWEGKRVQKFVNKGVAPVTTMHQGTVWPGKK